MQITKVGRPKLGTMEERHTRLLEAAMALFMQQGIAKTSIANISKFAGVSTRTIYEKYQNKDALLIAAFKQKIERDIKTLTSINAIDSLPPQEVLQQVGEKLLMLLLDQEMISFYRIGVSEAVNYPEISNQIKEIGPMRFHKVIQDYLRNHFNTVEEKRLQQSAVLFCDMLINQPRLNALFGQLQNDWDIKAHVTFVVDVFLNGFESKSCG